MRQLAASDGPFDVVLCVRFLVRECFDQVCFKVDQATLIQLLFFQPLVHPLS